MGDFFYHHRGLFYSCFSFVAFCCLNGLIYAFPALFVPHRVRVDKATDEDLQFKWRNFLCSVTHSLFAGTFALICILLCPQLAIRVIRTTFEPAFILVCISCGYFWYDMLNLFNQTKFITNIEIGCHHIFGVITCALILWTKTYVGFFVRKSSPLTGMSVALFVIIFFNFILLRRFGVSIWLVFVLATDGQNLKSIPVNIFMWLALFVLIFLNFLLFRRVILSDFVHPQKKAKVLNTRSEILAGIASEPHKPKEIDAKK